MKRIISIILVMLIVCSFIACRGTIMDTLTAEQIVEELKSSGMPITNVVVYDEKTDPNGLLGRPHQYTSKVNFSDPAHDDADLTSPDNTVEVFQFADDARKRATVIRDVTSATPALAEYVYQESFYVLRLNHDILPADAAKYEELFKVICSASERPTE